MLFKKWPPVAILDVQKSLCIAFLTISDQYHNFYEFILQNGCRWPFWMSENHFRSHFWPFQINTKLLFFLFLQNGQRRPFWMSEIHFRSHFWPFQINTQLFFFLKFLFLWNICTKWLPGPFWMSENHFRSHFWPFQINTQLLLIFFYKMAAVGHFGCLKFTLDHISGYFRSIPIFFFFLQFFLQNGCRWPFRMSEFHFRSHF